MFQSTPVIANGRIFFGQLRVLDDSRFQSTPVIANGRISGCRPSTANPGSFNPRPLLLTGESDVGRQIDRRVEGVSIHARYC